MQNVWDINGSTLSIKYHGRESKAKKRSIQTEPQCSLGQEIEIQIEQQCVWERGREQKEKYGKLMHRLCGCKKKCKHKEFLVGCVLWFE